MKPAVFFVCAFGLLVTACGDEEESVAATDFYSMTCSSITCHGASSYNQTSDGLRVDCEWKCASIYPNNEEMTNAVATLTFTRTSGSECFQLDQGSTPTSLVEICTPD